MWLLALPKPVKAALFGALAAVFLATSLWAYIANERRQAVAAERARAELEYHRNNAATRDVINQADRSTGNVDADDAWLCNFFPVDCLWRKANPH
jgi:hypothetical protein